MKYAPQAPIDDSPVARWVHDELERVAQALTEADDLALRQYNVEPTKPVDGSVAYADGTNWDPGGGEGLYMYFGGTWNKMQVGSFQPLDSDLTAIAALATTSFGRSLLTSADATTLFNTIKVLASTSVTGVVDKATDAEVRAATADKFIAADLLESASATAALTDAATVAVDWDAGINFTLTVTANRIIGNPTNGQPGTWRTIYVQGNDATDRTITFGTQYGSGKPTITDCDSTKKYLLIIYCVTTSLFLVSAMNGSA